MNGPEYDIFYKLGLTFQNVPNSNGYTIGAACSFAMIMIGLPQAPKIGAIFNFLPLRILGIISYSLYLIHPFYLIINFPELSATKNIGTGFFYEIFKQQEALPNWYFFFLFVPGVFVWAFLSYLIIEQPFLQMGKNIVKRKWPSPRIALPELKAA